MNIDMPTGTETILVVDDQETVLDFLIEALRNLGYCVLLAENGEDAVTIYRENPKQIDLVLLDMVMPKQGGPIPSTRSDLWIRMRRFSSPAAMCSRRPCETFSPRARQVFWKSRIGFPSSQRPSGRFSTPPRNNRLSKRVRPRTFAPFETHGLFALSQAAPPFVSSKDARKSRFSASESPRSHSLISGGGILRKGG